MNKQELIEKIKEIGTYDVNIFGTKVDGIPTESAIYLIKQLDEPQAGHAEEAPRYVRNIIARLRELPLHDREVWLKAIMAEFEQDFSHAKWREGYEQGKFEASLEIDKMCPVVKQFVAEWIEKVGGNLFGLNYDMVSEEIYDWVNEEKGNFKKLHLACAIGYEVEKEKRYTVKIKAVDQYLVSAKDENFLGFLQSRLRSKFTRKELEEAGFGWVFDCEGVEIEEVE